MTLKLVLGAVALVIVGAYLLALALRWAWSEGYSEGRREARVEEKAFFHKHVGPMLRNRDRWARAWKRAAFVARRRP